MTDRQYRVLSWLADALVLYVAVPIAVIGIALLLLLTIQVLMGEV